MTTMSEAVALFVSNYIVQSSLLLLPVCVVMIAVRRLGPSTEATACRCVLAAVMLMPLITSSMQAMGMHSWASMQRLPNVTLNIPLPVPPEASGPGLESQSQPQATGHEIDAYFFQSRTCAPGSMPATREAWPIACLLLSAAWFTASGILIMRFLITLRTVRRIRESGMHDCESQTTCSELALSLNIPCPVVLRSERVLSPCLVGVLNPAILLPSQSSDFPLGSEHVLIHELAHVQRQDVLWNWIFRLAIALFPFQPWLWWLHRRHETAAEQASDDLVVGHIDDPAAYARMLLALASSRTLQLPLAVGMSERSSLLTQRIHRILDDQCQHRRSASLKVRLFLLLVVMSHCTGISWFWLPAADVQAATAEASAQSALPHEWVVTGKVLGLDGQPAANASVVFTTNTYWNFQHTVTTNPHGQFSLRLGDEHVGIMELNILARAADQQALLYDSAQRPEKGEPSQPFVLKLERVRSIEVRVIDSADQLVHDAHTALQIAGSYLTRSTNSRGIAKFSVPERQPIERVAAWKNDVGFDFVDYRADPRGPVGPVLTSSFPNDGIQQIKLTGTKKFTVFVTDEAGQPIPNVHISVGQFQKSNSQSFATSLLEAHSQVRLSQPTDANGRTEFTCVPSWHEGDLHFWSQTREYERKQVRHPIWSDQPVRMKLERMQAISGRVANVRGQPVKGVRVRAIGDTYNIAHNEATTLTDAAGRYSLSVPPRHVYLVGVEEANNLAAATQTIVLAAGQSVTDVDLQLKAAHRVSGRVIDQDDKEPFVECWVFARQYGPRDRTANTALPIEYADTPWNGPYFNYSTQTDASGRYEFQLGEGDFEIFTSTPRQSQPIQFHCDADMTLKDIELDAGSAFSGSVIQATNASPVANARIEAWTLGLESWEAGTDARGKFKVRRPDGQTAIRVLSPDGKCGAIEVITSETNFNFNLQRLGQATGRLVSANGHPMPKRAIGYCIRMTVKHVKVDPRFAPQASFFGSAVHSDDKGYFKLDQLVADQDYYLTLYDEASNMRRTELIKVRVAPDQTLDLGDVKVR